MKCRDANLDGATLKRCRYKGEPTTRGGAARGFTLVEMMISVALVGLLMVGLNFFIFSMGELWGQGGEKRLFDQHVRAVSRFLERELRSASMPPAVDRSQIAFVTEEFRPSGGLQETLVSFELPEGNRLFSWPKRPLPEVVCAFQVREQKGLFMLWHSRLEERYEDDPPRDVLVSPFVTGMSYEYYDADLKRWTLETTLKRDNTGKYQTPQRLRLKFGHKKFVQEYVLVLPEFTEGLPNF